MVDAMDVATELEVCELENDPVEIEVEDEDGKAVDETAIDETAVDEIVGKLEMVVRVLVESKVVGIDNVLLVGEPDIAVDIVVERLLLVRNAPGCEVVAETIVEDSVDEVDKPISIVEVDAEGEIEALVVAIIELDVEGGAV